MSSPVKVRPLPLEAEYGKATGVAPGDIAKLRRWLATQPHLPTELITDLDLILTYHSCGGSAEVAKQVLDLNLTLRTLFAIFKHRVVDDKLIRDLHIYLPLPLEVRTPTGSAVFLARLIDYDVKNFVFQDGVRFAYCGCSKLNFGRAPVAPPIGSKTLEKFLPMDGLPKECRGKFKSLEQARDDMIARFKANADFFTAEAKKRVVESRRPGRPKTISDIFGGVDGSFKKLDID